MNVVLPRTRRIVVAHRRPIVWLAAIGSFELVLLVLTRVFG